MQKFLADNSERKIQIYNWAQINSNHHHRYYKDSTIALMIHSA